MSAAEKIEKLLDYLSISPKVFSERLGYERPQIIYDILKGKTKSISESLASKIVSVYTDVSRSWLLAGEGNMIVGEARGSAIQHIGEVNGDGNKILNSSSENISELIKMNAKYQDLLKKSQEQIDKLIQNNKEQADKFFALIELIKNTDK